jgi:hypothetical protein
MNWKIFFAISVILSWALFSCNPNPDPKDQDPAGANGKLDGPRDTIRSILTQYYADLCSEKLPEDQYFASQVDQFFGTADKSGKDVESIIRKGFDKVEGREIQLDDSSLKVSITDDGYLVEFAGRAQFVRTESKDKVSEEFRNRVYFTRDYRIRRYETIEAAGEPEAPAFNTRKIGMSMEGIMEFFENCRKKDFNKANEMVYPDLGVYFIYRPGAIDAFQRYNKLQDIFENAAWLESLLSEVECEPDYDRFPDFDCDTNFSEEGCFIREVRSFSRLSALMEALTELGLAEFDEFAAGEARKTEQVVGYEFLSTDLATVFYIGQIEGKWYLLVIDSARYDCSA